ASDCMTWEAHDNHFNQTQDKIFTDRISGFYKAHPESSRLSVIDVWRKVGRIPRSKTTENEEAKNAETWNNPHWYFNGYWWPDDEAQQLGFVEGYLLCMRTEVHKPGESYSQDANFYTRKINDFLRRANPKLKREAIATTLHRFRDKGESANPPR
ncbi:MAG: hypothetical protein M3O09_18640, partial [Acidobacteriota bacterium]|nr:hypothetical protein [Acidobacteriota bacterium]